MTYRIRVSPKKRREIAMGSLRFQFGTRKGNELSQKLFKKDADKLDNTELDTLFKELHKQSGR